MDWALTLSFGGYENWRLPTHDNNNPRPPTPTSDNEIGSLWYQLNGGNDIWSDTDVSPFTNLQLVDYEWYWTGSAHESDPNQAWRITMSCA